MLMLGWLGCQRVAIQRYKCQECRIEIISPERLSQASARQAWWSQVARLVCLSRFKFGLSVRHTQTLVEFVYGRPVSVGYIDKLTERVGKQAEAALIRLGKCRQDTAHFLLYDETFPKMEESTYSLGVVICENGLIRSVRSLQHKKKDIPAQLRDVYGSYYMPQYFLTDLDVHFNKYMRDAGLNLTHLRDKVHLLRHLIRLFDEAVRDITLDVPKKWSFKERKKQRKLKQRLLRKRLQPMLKLVLKAFSTGYESITVLILEGVVSQLGDRTIIIQTGSVKTLRRRLQRFVKKHGSAINTLLYLALEKGTPTTTNALESKNGIFKPHKSLAKFFPEPTRCQSFFAAVALMENFDIKKRGPNAGTNSMQRANINLDDFGATDFFSTVGLAKPQISQISWLRSNHAATSQMSATESVRLSELVVDSPWLAGFTTNESIMMQKSSGLFIDSSELVKGEVNEIFELQL